MIHHPKPPIRKIPNNTRGKIKQILTLLITVLLSPYSTALMAQNELHQHHSPYLAMHGQDPIHWHTWNAQILQKAKAENKLIFISSGYFSCHWCHVMHKESYQNQITANLLNQHFISIKVDRELNPELDNTLIDFAQRAIGQAGWPQHVVLTPDGYPFAAFIYLNNQDFNTTLNNIIRLWKQYPETIHQLAQDFIPPYHPPAPHTIIAIQFQSQLLQQVMLKMDDFSGGIVHSSGSSKFPNAPLLHSILNMPVLPKAIEEWLILTLDQMQSQHLFDHIHGGFFRYTIDPEWQTPHFEKMAYTNALLSQIYLQAGKRFQRSDYFTTAQKTLNYLAKYLYNSNTQLYRSSQSAIDANHQEGGHYLWSKRALKQQLTPSDFKALQTAWQLELPAPYEQGWLPKPDSTLSAEQWKRIQAQLQTPPEQIPTDSKSILGWNGLILSAYAQAYQTFRQPIYLQKGKSLAYRLSTLIQQESPPRALSLHGQPMGEATLEDYAFIYQGLKDWQEAHPNKTHITTLNQLESTILKQFLNTTGWQYHSAPLLPGQQATWQIKDNAIPSPTALVSCIAPKTLALAGSILIKQPIEYASYYQALNHCPPT